MNEFPGTVNEHGNYVDPYDRGGRIPVRFVGDAAQDGVPPLDKFTQNLIANHAQEGLVLENEKTPDEHAKPTGQFFLTKE